MKKNKTHIKDPRDWKRSLCGRITVTWSDPPKDATCNHCMRMVKDGRWARYEKQRKAHKSKSFNNKGAPTLTAMQIRFAQHPLVTTNPLQAALDAGYSESYAKTNSKYLRKQLYHLIMDYQEEAAKRAVVSKARVQTELAHLAFANIKDYFISGHDGNLVPKTMDELTREQAAALQEYKLVKFEDGKYRLAAIKLADKRANLVDLGKTLGMFIVKHEVEDKRKASGLADVPTDALEQAERFLLQAARGASDKLKDRKAITADFTPVETPVEE